MEEIKKEIKETEIEDESIIEQANKAAERLEIANEKQEELIKRQEELYAKKRLLGSAEAGIISPQKSEEEIKKQGAIEFWTGTPIADAIKKYG
jgi:hypothetical protein